MIIFLYLGMCDLEIKFGHVQLFAMRLSDEMALFGMVWLLRVRSEMKRCAKCRRQDLTTQMIEDRASTSTFFTIDTTTPNIQLQQPLDTISPGHSLAPTTYCEVHGYNPRKEGKFLTQNSL